MKKLILCLVLFFFGFQNLILSQENQVNANYDSNKDDFFKDKVYVFQSSNFLAMHLIQFTKENTVQYLISSIDVSVQNGKYSYSNGKLIIHFDNQDPIEYRLEKLSEYTIQLTHSTGNLRFAEMLSPEDYYTAAINSGANYNTPPMQQYNTPNNSQTVKSICPICNGTGRRCVLQTVATYGTHSAVKQRCTVCSALLTHGTIHTQQRCSNCQGTGYK